MRCTWIGSNPVVAVVAARSQHHPLAAAGGDSVIQWNQNAGDAAIKACITPTDDGDPFHELRTTQSCILLFMMR